MGLASTQQKFVFGREKDYCLGHRVTLHPSRLHLDMPLAPLLLPSICRIGGGKSSLRKKYEYIVMPSGIASGDLTPIGRTTFQWHTILRVWAKLFAARIASASAITSIRTSVSLNGRSEEMLYLLMGSPVISRILGVSDFCNSSSFFRAASSSASAFASFTLRSFASFPISSAFCLASPAEALAVSALCCAAPANSLAVEALFSADCAFDSASPASIWSEPTSSCARASCVSSTMKALPSNTSSPAIPKTTKSGPIEWISSFLNTQRSNGVDFLQIHLSPISVSLLKLCHSSTIAPIVRTKADTPAAIWSSVRLFQNRPNADSTDIAHDHKNAQFAAKMRIWLIILAFPVVIFAALIRALFEIIHARKAQ
jgi:hypothetical protein